jgi:hypothetical protein
MLMIATRMTHQLRQAGATQGARPELAPASGDGVDDAAGQWPRETGPGLNHSRAVPDKPVLDGIEDKWSQRWHEARVVQV